MSDWLIEASHGPDADPESIVKRQLDFSFAAIHITTNHLTNVIFDLAARWNEYTVRRFGKNFMRSERAWWPGVQTDGDQTL
jgi:hypothetical protein